MSCYICCRGNCSPVFHSCEEQIAFEAASEAYDNFLQVSEKCREEWVGREEDDAPELP